MRKDSSFRGLSSLPLDDRREALKAIKSKIGVHSEIGRLRKVFLHTPGKEVELMTPSDAGEQLYNDILYYKNIAEGYAQLKSVLSLTSTVYEVSDCLTDVLQDQDIREEVLNQILYQQGSQELKPELLELPAADLTKAIIGGVPLKRNTITSWLSQKTFSLSPLPNLYFMRDSSVVLGNRMISTRMANPVRFTEAVIMRTIYEYHPEFKGHGILLDGCYKNHDPQFTIEGGDVLIVNENLFLLGISDRTTSIAVDALIDNIIRARQEDGNSEPFNVLCVLLPRERSTIHLDMIFTVVNKEQAVVYPPYILGRQRARVVRIRVKPDGDKKFKEIEDLMLGFNSVGVRMDPIPCGGGEYLHQQREQWNSGANFFSFAPGKVISYFHEHTLHACESAGFKIVSAKDVVKHPSLLQNDSPVVVAIEGSELSRGGGGPRCMTCPVLRDPV